MADGNSITFSTDLDNKDLERKLQRLTRDIEKYEDRIQKNRAKKAGIDAQAAEIRESYKKALAAGQDGLAQTMVKQFDGLAAQSKRLGDRIAEDTADLERTKEAAGGVAQELAQASQNSGALDRAVSAAEKRMSKLGQRVKGLAKRVLIFSMITMALRGAREWFGNVIKSNDQAVAALAKLKGALLTMAQPLMSILVPGLVTLINLLTRLATVAAQVMASLFGMTFSQAKAAAKGLNQEAAALNKTGGAAKKASRSLAAFDEINQLPSTEDGGGGSGAISPDFDLGEEMEASRLAQIMEMIRAIGAGLLAWKLSDSFLGGLRMFLGLLLAIHGAGVLAQAVWDAWENGVTGGNLAKALGGLALLVLGLTIAFGGLGLAIGLIVGGAVLLITAIRDIAKNGLNLKNGFMALIGVFSVALGIGKLVGASFGAIAVGAAIITAGLALLVHGVQDAIKNGWSLENTLTALAGIILTGLGIAMLTGTWIPLLIAGILGILFAIATLSGNGTELINNLKLVFSGLIKFVTGVFSGDWRRAWEGVKEIFKGVWNGVVTLLESAVNLIIRGLNWLISKMNRISFTVPSWVPGIGGNTIGPDIPSIPAAKIPRLATGAVIPPNREFMAVLGDQKSGRNIEAPEALLRQMAAEAAGANTQLLREILQAIREGRIIMVDKTVLGRTARDAMHGLARSGY